MSDSTPSQQPHQGRLEDEPLADILERLTQERLTGTLALSQSGAVKAVYLKDGKLVFASSNATQDRLGETLVRNGIISQQALSAATAAMRESGKREGETLVEMGVLAPKALFEGLKLQVEELIISLFLWEEGEYRFMLGPLPSHVIPLPIRLEDLLPKALDRLNPH
jgi:hypothetical protein